MKQVFALSFLAIFLSHCVANAQSTPIKWEKDFGKAQALARKLGKPMLLDFTASWCKPCIAMDKEFWILDDVAQSVESFIAVKLDYDVEKRLVSKYGATAIPFVVFTDPLGNMVAFRRGFGSKNVRELNLIFDEMPKDFSPLLPFYDSVESNKNDGASWLKIADAYRSAKMTRLSCDFYKKALKAPDIQNDIEKKDRIMTTIGINYYSINDFEMSSDTLRDYLEAFPKGKNREIVFYALIISKVKLRKFKDADKNFELFKIEFPESKRSEQAKIEIEKGKSKKDKD
jgi:thiol-disulfide isomerase/thioredoxin